MRCGGGVKDEKIEYHGGSLKNPIFRGGFTKSQYKGGNCLEGGALRKAGRWCFWGRSLDTPMHTMLTMDHELFLEKSSSAAVYTLLNTFIYLKALNYFEYQTETDILNQP